MPDPPARTPRRPAPPTVGRPGAAPEAHESAWRWIRIAAVVISVYGGYQLVLALQSLLGNVLTVALYALFGIIVALLAAPLVTVIERTVRLPRTLAVLMVLLGGLVIVGTLGFLIAAPLASEARALYDKDFPRLINSLSETLSSVQRGLAAHGVNVGTGGLSDSTVAEISSRVGGVLVSGVTGTASAVVDIVVVLVVSFWVLRDGEELRAGVMGLLPGRFRSEVDFAFDAFAIVIGGYVRAQVVVAFIIAVIAGIGCSVLGVPFPLVIGIAVGVFELIPIVGPFVGGAVALVLAATVSGILVLVTGIFFIGIHVVEAYVIGPRIQARFVQLHPLVALLALLAGIEAGGFVGAFFAVPAASLLAVFVRAAVGDWRAQRPDLFAIEDDRVVERRRRRLLREFRLFRRGPQ